MPARPGPFEHATRVPADPDVAGSTNVDDGVEAAMTEPAVRASAATYSNDKVGYGSGAMDDFLTGTRQQVVDVLKLLQTELENLNAALDEPQASGAAWD